MTPKGRAPRQNQQPSPALTGWLYTSTCFAATKAVRSERRRQARELEAYQMQATANSAGESADWGQIRPVLDSAMLERKDTDRDAVLMRFFERRSLADIGGKLGLSEDAARMRIERALERLRERLSKRGVTSTAAALALALAHQTITAAPLGLAASITAGSLAAAGALTAGKPGPASAPRRDCRTPSTPGCPCGRPSRIRGQAENESWQ